ncbi:BIR-domain-containing protein [Tothia fuscella]|uniref:BIR-domain-containing protein n=1 Tax=Tothia fuscella TaxID=1048955 RepID=A0A9P4P4F4_9PEZI|nr:BIR-domain-containing protein [Tothia fuscella]
MAFPEGITTLQGRIDTFAVAHHITKRRASSVKKRTPATVSWPHNFLLPAELARAGFFYKPTGDSNDNCVCFICQRQLDGWEEGDDPVEEHIKHAPECGWAVNAVISKRTSGGMFVNEDPMSEKLAESRRATFADLWPYEGKKGWKCKVNKMVAAGWCYDPSPEYDDGVTCMYCNLSLDGWEPKDDPFKEHQKRAPECEFFRLLEEWAAARKQATGRRGRASKASRLSTQSNMTAMSEAPRSSMASMDEAAGEDDSILTTATNATITSKAGGKGRKKAAPKAKGKATRGKKNTSKLDSFVIATDPIEPEVQPIDEEPIVEELPKKKATRKTSRAVSRTVSSQLEDTLGSSQSRPTRAQSTKAKGKQQRVSADESQLQAELQAAVESSLVEREETPKPKRGTKRTSDGMAKLDSSVVMLPDEPPNFQELQEKPKRGRKATKKQSTVEPEIEASDAASTSQRVSSAPGKTGLKSKKGKKAAKSADPEPEPELEELPEPEIQYPDPGDEDVQMNNFAQSLVAPVNPYLPDSKDHQPDAADRDEEVAESSHHTPEALTTASPFPDTPTPARHSSARIIRNYTPAKPAFEIAQDATPPASSPQSSDAENQPPSSKPSKSNTVGRPLPPIPQSMQRIPLADTTPDHTIKISPSKRNILANITSTKPWTPTDLENIFLISPIKKNLALNAVPLNDWNDKENQAALDAVDLDKLDKVTLGDVVRRVKMGMSDVEKGMSVEEWVRWNAARGEERLRGECEGLVGVFEREGGRAVGCLEGVVAVDH